MDPFNKILGLGYYDGVTEGLATSTVEAVAYRFALVAWDANQDNRIYSLSNTDTALFDSVIRIFSTIEEPRWPVWVPKWRFNSPLEEERLASDLKEILAKIPSPLSVFSTDDLRGRIRGIRTLDDAARRRLPGRRALPDPREWLYWQAFLSGTV